MILCMRTTININDSLFQAAKLRAAETNRTLAAVVEDALRLTLLSQPHQQQKRVVKLPTFGSGGLLPGVDLTDTSALLDRMDGRE